MAIFRLEAKIIGRKQGRSATAAAAYRAAARIEDERTGIVFDYTKKRGVLHAEVIAPQGTPDWMMDRAKLWNAVETVEKRKDAQLAREILLSLPHELPVTSRLALVRSFVQHEFVSQGMIADIALHAPDRKADERNYHAHVLLTTRCLTGNGFGPKERGWNDTDLLEHWREHWADAVNTELARHGLEARVDHRSLADQGVDREPEPKQGPVATDMERAGRPSHAGGDRRDTKKRNQHRAELQGQLATLEAELRHVGDDPQERGTAMPEDVIGEDIPANGLNAADTYVRAIEMFVDDRNLPKTAEDQAFRLIEQTKELEATQKKLDLHREQQAREAEEERQRSAGRGAAGGSLDGADQPFASAKARYSIALGDNYDVTDPYRSLAKAAMAEYGAFIRDREKLRLEIARASTPEERELLKCQMAIEAADYMAITSHRIAAQSEVIVGRKDTTESIRFRERAAGFEAQGKVLRQAYPVLAQMQDRDGASRETPKDRAQSQSERSSSQAQRSIQSDSAATPRADKERDKPEGEISDAKAASKTRDELRAAMTGIVRNSAPPGRGGGGRSR